MVKLIIWAANINAPITPINGILRSSSSSLTFLEQNPIRPALAAHMVPPTTGEINASAMCIIKPPFTRKTFRLPRKSDQQAQKNHSGMAFRPCAYLRGLLFDHVVVRVYRGLLARYLYFLYKTPPGVCQGVSHGALKPGVVYAAPELCSVRKPDAPTRQNASFRPGSSVCLRCFAEGRSTTL